MHGGDFGDRLDGASSSVGWLDRVRVAIHGGQLLFP